MGKPVQYRSSRITQLPTTGQAIVALQAKQPLAILQLADCISTMFGGNSTTILKNLEYNILPFLLNKEIRLPNGKNSTIVKEIEKKYVLWTYRIAEATVDDAVKEMKKQGSVSITVLDIASRTGLTPKEIEPVVYPIIKRHGMEIRSETIPKYEPF